MDAATTRHGQYTHSEQALYVAFELSLRTWKLGLTIGFGQKARERNLPAGDLAALDEEIRLAKKRFGLSPSALSEIGVVRNRCQPNLEES